MAAYYHRDSVLFAAIADDFTGGSDLAGMLFEQGVRTALLFGAADLPESGYDAAVVCLKTRSIPAADARRQTRVALERIVAAGVRQVQFKYCSTFDSTPAGNIGPVIDELMSAMDVAYTVAVPALPVNGRTQYLGHLFVNGQLLSESPMRHHPLNPMEDSNLVRWLQRQTSRKIGLIPLNSVRTGAFTQPEAVEIALVDAVADEDLHSIAEAVCDLPLITGGSGLGMKLPQVWRQRGLLTQQSAVTAAEPPRPGTLILAGSCSAATLQQLDALEQSGVSAIRVDVPALGPAEITRLERAARTNLDTNGVAAIRSSAPAGERATGAEAAIEKAFADLARRLAPSVGTLIVAGGETSGAVIEALEIRAVELTRIIDPGVPMLRTLYGDRLSLALKSGNFGSRDFFAKAMHNA